MSFLFLCSVKRQGILHHDGHLLELATEAAESGCIRLHNLASRSVHGITLSTLLPFAGQGMPIHFALLVGHAWHLTDLVLRPPLSVGCSKIDAADTGEACLVHPD
jgi:hypothetical protein